MGTRTDLDNGNSGDIPLCQHNTVAEVRLQMTDLELLYTSEEDFAWLKEVGLVELFDKLAAYFAECHKRETVVKLVHLMIVDIQNRFINKLSNGGSK